MKSPVSRSTAGFEVTAVLVLPAAVVGEPVPQALFERLAVGAQSGAVEVLLLGAAQEHRELLDGAGTVLESVLGRQLADALEEAQRGGRVLEQLEQRPPVRRGEAHHQPIGAADLEDPGVLPRLRIAFVEELRQSVPARGAEDLAPRTIVVSLAELADLAAELFEVPAGLAATDAAAAEAQRPGRAHRVLEIHRGARIGIPELLEQGDAGAMELEVGEPAHLGESLATRW